VKSFSIRPKNFLPSKLDAAKPTKNIRMIVTTIPKPGIDILKIFLKAVSSFVKTR